MDWNFSGTMRPRPNKWRIEMDESREVNLAREIPFLILGWRVPGVQGSIGSTTQPLNFIIKSIRVYNETFHSLGYSVQCTGYRVQGSEF